MSANQEEISLEVKNIVKTYPGVVALNQVSIAFRKGEVHALIGENGAGKSTLMNVISGVTAPDSGTFIIQGESFAKITPNQARKEGVRVIYQELNLVPTLSVTENIFMGAFEGNHITVDMKRMRKRVEELFAYIGIKNIDPDEMVENLTVAQMQLVEITKAVSSEVKILVMDEPTAPLTTHEVEILFRLIHKLKEKGVTIIYISHRLNEIYEVTDRLTVLRDGMKVITKDTKDTTREELIKYMVGRELKETYPPRTQQPGDKILEVKSLYGNGLRDINFYVRKGEILGVAGLVGAGRTELMRLIFGADPKQRGEVILEGKKQDIHSPGEAVDKGIALVPEDRKLQGVLLELSIKENLILPTVRQISKRLVIDRKKEKETIEKQMKGLKIKAPSVNQLVRNLSGGNQQKVVVGKWLAGNSRLLIFDEPTRGIDVGAKQEIYHLMNEMTEQGISIIMVSSEMEELLGMSDRILVLREGRIAGTLDRKEDFNQENIMRLAAIN